MTSRAELERLVSHRAADRCEYCRMHQSLQGAQFHLEHILPTSRGGVTELENLAWACPGCNLRKSDRVERRVLGEIAAIPFPEVVNMESKTAFDEASDNYLVVVTGWEGVKRLHGCMIYVEIKNDKIWIHLDGTEHGIAREFLEAGIRKDQIVLGFKSPQSRRHTEFAIA